MLLASLLFERAYELMKEFSDGLAACRSLIDEFGGVDCIDGSKPMSACLCAGKPKKRRRGSEVAR
jgi:hypothetical protein